MPSSLAAFPLKSHFPELSPQPVVSVTPGLRLSAAVLCLKLFPAAAADLPLLTSLSVFPFLGVLAGETKLGLGKEVRVEGVGGSRISMG